MSTDDFGNGNRKLYEEVKSRSSFARQLVKSAVKNGHKYDHLLGHVR